MKIYLDGLFYKGSGIGRYYSNLVKLFSENNIEVITAVPLRLKTEWLTEFREHRNITPIFVEYERFAFKHIIRHSRLIKKLKEKRGVEVFWFPHVNLPLWVPDKAIVTVHDVRPFTEWWDRGILAKTAFKMLVERAIKTASTVVVPSNFSREALLNFFPEAEDKLKVIYNFIDVDVLKDYLDDRETPIVDDKYILFVGNRKKHKNLKNLIVAFSKISTETEYKLVIAGARDSRAGGKDEVDILISELGLNERIQQFIYPSDKVIFNLYKYADLFVFPSLYEGFGYPPLEAMMCGCAVLASNIPVLREILGEDIACLDPCLPEDMALKIKELIQNPKKKNLLANIGNEVSKKYLKENVASEFLCLLEGNFD